MVVNILGTEYTIEKVDRKDNDYLAKNQDTVAYCESLIKKIMMAKTENEPYGAGRSEEIIRLFDKQALRHELIHAFLNESGLQDSSDWASNDEMVDWFAHQFPKMVEAFRKTNCL